MAITDNFPYPNGSLSSQAVWATTVFDGTMDVLGNAAVGVVNDTRANIRTDNWGPTQFSTVTYITGGGFVGVICHGSDSGSGLNGYTFGVSIADGSWFLEVKVNGATTIELDTGVDAGFTVNDTVGIGIDGNDVVAYINGVEVGRGTNTTYRLGKPGIFAFTDGSITLDTWVGTGESAGTAITGTGALTAAIATVIGSGTVNGVPAAITGTGTPSTPIATASGAGARGSTDMGGSIELTTSSPTVSGIGTVDSAAASITGSGALSATKSTTAGSGARGHHGTGVLTV
jgi:hypothetical protein